MIAAALISFAGCANKSPSKTELRAVTGEIVSAARDAAGRKSEITIRPETPLSRPGEPDHLPVDDIYISLSDASRLPRLTQALAEIARRHKLSVLETSAGDVTRVDFSFHDDRTHAIRIVTPLAAHSRPPVERARGNPQLAIVIDDLGHDRAAAELAWSRAIAFLEKHLA